MLKLALRRIAALIPTLLIIVTVSFAIIRLAPGGPFDEEQGVSPAVRANLERLYGLDQPLARAVPALPARARPRRLRTLAPPARFHGERAHRAGAAAESAALGLCAIALALITAIPAGIAAALWRGPGADLAIAAVGALGVALPSFVIGPLLALVFGVHLRWLPVAGWQAGAPRYLVLPVLTLALPLAAALARLTRASLLEVLRAPFVRSARARGLGEARVLWHHALRPALLPVASYLGPAIAFVVTGSLVVEAVFGLPGTGRYLVQGAIDRDYPLVMGMVIVYGALTLFLNLLADLACGWLDPGTRHE